MIRRGRGGDWGVRRKTQKILTVFVVVVVVCRNYQGFRKTDNYNINFWAQV